MDQKDYLENENNRQEESTYTEEINHFLEEVTPREEPIQEAIVTSAPPVSSVIPPSMTETTPVVPANSTNVSTPVAAAPTPIAAAPTPIAQAPHVIPQPQPVQSPTYTQSPNHTYPQYPPYGAQGGSYKAVGSQPPTTTPKKKGGKVKFIAALLAVAITAGVGSSGATYYLLKDRLPESTSISEQVPEESSSNSSGLNYSSVPSPHSNISEVAAIVLPQVVEVTTESATTNPFFGELISGGAGSGVIVSEDGYIVTNNHVVETATSITVTTHDGVEYAATLVGRDQETDLAVLKIEATGLEVATLADSDELSVGDLAVVVGNPLGTLGGTVTDGIISALNREITIEGQKMNLIQTSAAVNQGNSGGGLFDANGHLVGVINAKSSGSGIEGLGFAIPSNLAKEVIAQIIDVGYVSGRPQLGISVIEIMDEMSMRRYNVEEMGVYVAEITRENGLVAGDLILAIDETEIKAFQDIQGILEIKKAGDSVRITVKRDGKEMELDVELGEKVPDYVEKAEPSKTGA